MKLTSYLSRMPKLPTESCLKQIVKLVFKSKKHVLYVGGGCLKSNDELRVFVEITGIPVASTLTGLGTFPIGDEVSLHMLGMHGIVYANYAVDQTDILLTLGMRFDDIVTGNLKAFAIRPKIVHIDIDPVEIGKKRQPHVSICSDVNLALKGMNKILESKGAKGKLDFRAWRNELNEKKKKFPLSFKTFRDVIPPQYTIQVLDELTC